MINRCLPGSRRLYDRLVEASNSHSPHIDLEVRLQTEVKSKDIAEKILNAESLNQSCLIILFSQHVEKPHLKRCPNQDLHVQFHLVTCIRFLGERMRPFQRLTPTARPCVRSIALSYARFSIRRNSTSAINENSSSSSTDSYSVFKKSNNGDGHFTLNVEKKNLPSGGHIAHLFFQGPKKYPILNLSLEQALEQEFRNIGKDDGLRALFLRSTVAGADLKYMKELKGHGQATAFIGHIVHLCQTIQDYPVPVVAFIEGPCLGAGMEIAASCDVRIGVQGEKTIFGMPETRVVSRSAAFC